MLRFNDAGECRRVCRQAGLDAVTSHLLPLVWDLPAPDGLLAAAQAGGVRLTMLLDAQTPPALEAITCAVSTASEPYARAGRLRIPMAVVLTSATRREWRGEAARSVR
jgi:hypothetical protein